MNVQNDEWNDEISLLEIVNFLQCAWRVLIISVVVGAFSGFAYWFIFVNYSAEYIFLNAASNTNTNTKTNTNSNSSSSGYGLEPVSWRILQKSLPNLAAQIIERGKLTNNQASLYSLMSDEGWWQKKVSIAYSFSKSDANDLIEASENLDVASRAILSIKLTAFGSTADQATSNVIEEGKFLRTGGAYVQLRTLLSGYEAINVVSISSLQQEMTTTQIEINYLEARIQSLETLHRRFPSNSNLNQQVVDPKDSGAKYMPITTQIIAAINDVNNLKERMSRLKMRLDQMILVKKFIDQAKPLQDRTFDGLILVNELLLMDDNFRSKLVGGDLSGRELLDQIHGQLLTIQARFTSGLEANTAPIASKKPPTLIIFWGALGAFCMTILFLVLRYALTGIKSPAYTER